MFFFFVDVLNLFIERMSQYLCYHCYNYYVYFRLVVIFSVRYYKQQQEALNAWKNTPFVAGYNGVPNYAYATGALGPNGIQQTAGVFPPNKVS